MTDRAAALYVALDSDIRQDDIEPLLAAIRCLRGVAKVDFADAVLAPDVWAAQARVEFAAQENLYWLTRTSKLFEHGFAKAIYDTEQKKR